MNLPLFVHTNAQLLDRILKESNQKALITTSMVQALQWITNPETKISGVFLSPDDSTFSAFRFLEVSLTHRPALPIFLFESTLNRNNEVGQKIMKSTHVKGIFSGSESFQTLVTPLKAQSIPLAEVSRKVPKHLSQAGYVALPISDFFIGTHYPYDIFIMGDENSMRLFAQKEAPIDPSYLTKASQTNPYLYVRDTDVEENRKSIKEAQVNLLYQSDFPTSWQSSEVMVNARTVLHEMKKSGVSESMVEYTQTMLGDLFKLISNIESDEEGSIFGMIEKAQKCDRSVFCASYAMLICKQMRFEKTATLEILGLASVLQDVSLYKTPFGDLSDKLYDDLNEAELAFYLQHPTLSADLISQHTDVPQVTLQVVRQQHERKDKTGFPHRVGGSQLHPMAEILSLINSYFEVTKKLKSDAEIIEYLNKNVFQHYSETVVTSFKQVLGNILKDKISAAQIEQSS